MEWGYPQLVLAPIFGLASNCALHIMLSRIAAGGKPYTCLRRGVVLGVFVTGALCITVVEKRGDNLLDSIFLIALGLATYLALAYGYFAFVNLNLTSLRIRILQELLSEPHGLSNHDILARYNARTVVEGRVERLVRQGQVAERDGRIQVVGRSYLFLARLIDALRWIIFGRLA